MTTVSRRDNIVSAYLQIKWKTMSTDLFNQSVIINTGTKLHQLTDVTFTSIGQGHGFVQNRRQVIVRIYDDPVQCRIYRYISIEELTSTPSTHFLHAIYKIIFHLSTFLNVSYHWQSSDWKPDFTWFNDIATTISHLPLFLEILCCTPELCCHWGNGSRVSHWWCPHRKEQ